MVKNVLIIDNDGINNFLLEHTLLGERLASNVKSFLSAEAALEFLAESSENANWAHVILLDINMPGMSGWEFIEHYRPLKLNTPIVMISSSIDENDHLNAERTLEVIGFITKPFRKENFMEITKQI